MEKLRVLLSKKEVEELRAGRINTLTVWKEGTFRGSQECMEKDGIMATIVEEPWDAVVSGVLCSKGPHD